MADTNQEQLLNELLRDIRAADEHASAAGLEARVTAEWEARHRTTVARSTTINRRRYAIVMAAATLLAVGGSLLNVPHEPLPWVQKPSLAIGSANTPVAIPTKMPAAATRGVPQSIAQPPIAQSPIAQSPMEFVPLLPLTPYELSGPFQLVRVQMPRASLGAMAPPAEYPGPFVEADVLLGEDGMARAIRVSAGGSGNPWRSR